jgi:fermentation-respiration switch protein FrsA (DUF1100 family)
MIAIGFLAGPMAALGVEWPCRWRPGQNLERKLLFHPTPHTEHWLPAPPWIEVQDVWLPIGEGRIHAWWFPRTDARGVVLLCHGNAGNLSHRLETVVALMRALDVSVLIFDYPGYGRSSGKPSEAGCYAAADAAYDWLRKVQGIPPEQIVLFGESLGGGVATDLAVRQPHRALVLVRTFTSIPDMAKKYVGFASCGSLVRNRFDNRAKIGDCPRPVFIAHGDADRLIPFSQAEELFQAAPQPKQFFLMKGCGHNDPLPAEFLEALADFLK